MSVYLWQHSLCRSSAANEEPPPSCGEVMFAYVCLCVCVNVQLTLHVCSWVQVGRKIQVREFSMLRWADFISMELMQITISSNP